MPVRNWPPLPSHRGLDAEAAKYLAEAEKMDQVIRKHGWDGEWFLRAYDDFGAKIGSKECEEGKIFIETNGYCVLAGIGLEDGHGRQGARVHRASIWPPSTASSCSSRPTPGTT